MLAWKSTDCHGAVFGTSERELNQRLSPLVLANENKDRKKKRESKWQLLASSSVQQFSSEILGFNLKEKSLARRVSPRSRDGLFLSASPVDLPTRTKTALTCRCFTLAVMLTKYPFQPPGAPCLSVCLICALFLSLSLPPKLVSQLLLTPRDKAVPVVTSADTTRGTHARLAHAPLACLLSYAELVGGKN